MTSLKEGLDNTFSALNGGQHCLSDVDLALTIGQVGVYTIVGGLAVSSGVENVADDYAIGEGTVSNLTNLSGAIVGQGDEEFTLAEGEEGVVTVALNVTVVPDLRLLALGVHCRDHVVQISVGVASLPHRLTICRVITTIVVLLITVVDEGDAT